MKTQKILMTMLVLMLMGSSAFAKPERLEIKDPKHRINERAAKAQIKNIDLKNIEDPEARKAIQQILTYLNLQTK